MLNPEHSNPSSELPPPVCRALAMRYGAAAQDLKRVSTINSGPDSHTWIVELFVDSQKCIWCVKRHRSKDKHRIRFELGLAHLLRASGCELAPNVVLNTDGDLCSLCDDGAVLSVSQYVKCDGHFNWTTGGWSNKHSYRAGQVLFNFHAATGRILSSNNQYAVQVERHAPSCAAALRTDLVVALEAARLQSGLLPPAVAQEPHPVHIAAAEAARLLALFDHYYARTFGSSSEPQWVLIHGDYHPGNVLFRNGEAVAIVDMDYMQIGPTLYDLGYGAFLFGQCGTRPDLMESLIAGYFAQQSVELKVPQDIHSWIILSALVVTGWLIGEAVAAKGTKQDHAAVKAALSRSLSWLGKQP